MRARILFFLVLVIPVVFLPAIAESMPSLQNLIKNGDFEAGLTYWEQGVISPRGTDYPIIQVVSKDANHYLLMDVPEPSAGYVEQKGIQIPHGAHVILSMKTWGATQPVEVRVLVIDSTGRTDEIDSFDPEGKVQIGGTPTHHAYNLTAYSGRTITLRLAAAGLTMTGSIAMFDDIVLAASYGDHSIITIDVSDRGVFAHQTGFAPLTQLVTVRGMVIPIPEKTVTVYVGFTGPEENFINQTTTDQEGGYSLTINFTMPGIWIVRSYWIGDGKILGALSAPREFVVAKSMEVQLTRCTVRGLPIDNLTEPGFEVRPGENITASFTVSTGDAWILTNVFVVMLTSWEPNKWVVVSFQWGWNTEPLYYKQVYVAPDNFFRYVQRNRFTGRYETNATVSLPLAGDHFSDIYTIVNKTTGESEAHAVRGGIPSFTAPMKNGTYYIGFLMSEVNSAQDLVNEQKVWTRPADYFEKLVPLKRTIRAFQFVRVGVVDVDPYMKAAKDAIDTANANFLDVTNAQQYYDNAIGEYNKGHYSKATEQSKIAKELADKATLALQMQLRSSLPFIRALTILSENVVSTTGTAQIVRDDSNRIEELIGQGDFGRAQRLETKLESEVSGDILVYILLVVIFWLGLGDIAARVIRKRDPVENLNNLIAPILPSFVKRRGVSQAIAVVALFVFAVVVEEALGFGFPRLGSLLLAVCVVAGWETEFVSNRLVPRRRHVPSQRRGRNYKTGTTRTSKKPR